MVRRFVVDTPEQLRNLRELAVMSGEKLQIASVAAVWSADRRKHGGGSKWDGRILVCFECGKATTGMYWRHSYVARIASNGEIREEAELHYNKALRWCENNMRPAL